MRKMNIIFIWFLISMLSLGVIVYAKRPYYVHAKKTRQQITVDGYLDLTTEYKHAESASFTTRDGLVIFYVQQDKENLYLGLDIDDTDSFPSWGDQVFIGFDLTHDLQYLDDTNDFFILWHGDPHARARTGLIGKEPILGDIEKFITIN